MRQVLIDEMLKTDAEKLARHLEEHIGRSEVEGLFWVELAGDLLDPDQYGAKDDHPFGFAVEVGETWAKFEFLVRSRSNFRSRFTRYATSQQQRFILDYANRLVEDLSLST